jgi:phage-related protein
VPSIANILLQVTGDSEDAQRALADVSRDLAVFGRETAEAEADVDTAGASAHLDELKAKLAAFSTEDASAEVNVQIAKAQADIAVLQAELDRIDGEDVTVDVNVRKSIASDIGAIVREVDRLDSSLTGVTGGTGGGGGLGGFISKIAEAAGGAKVFGASLSEIAVAAPVVIASVVAIVGQLVAMVASAASAAGGVGALAVALGATLLPAIALGVGAIARFKEQSKEAGTAAHALSGNVSDLASVFTKATAGGSDALFKGLSDGIRALAPMVEKLGPAFTRLGKAGGDAIRLLADQFSSPAWRKFFQFSIDSLARLTPLFARSFGAFAKILANIAQASMPFLLQAFRGLAKGLEAIAGKTSDIKGLRDSIGGMVDSLRAWGHLLGGIVDLAGAFVKAFAPIGDSIVNSLGDGAENLAKWLESSEGLRKVQQFFEDTGPLASELGKLILNVTLALIQFGELVAPALTPVIHLLNTIFELVNKILSFANDHSFGDAFAKAVAPLGLIKAALGLIGPAAQTAFSTVSDVVSKIVALVTAPIKFQLQVARDVLGVIADIWKAAKDKVSDVIKFVLHAPRDVLGVIRDIWHAAKGIVSKVVNFVLHAPRDVLGVVRSIWQTAKGIVSDVISFVLRVPHDAAGAARALWGDVKGVISDAIDFVLDLPGVGGLVSAARAIWNAINSALPDITIDINIPTPNIPIIGHASGLRGPAPGHLAEVGEMGRELMFIPRGADIFTAGETRRILRALADGVTRPLTGGGASVPALAGGGGGTAIGTQTFQFITPGTGNPDPRIAMAQAALIQRQKGRR